MDVCIYVQLNVIMMAQNLVFVSQNFLFSTRRTRILLGFCEGYRVLKVELVNLMGRILSRRQSLRNSPRILSQPICIRLHVCEYICVYT